MRTYRFNGDGRNREISDYFAISFADDPGRTQQNFGKECDINTIFAKYRATGLVRVPSRARQPIYADLPSAADLHSALNLIFKSQSEFSKLPADVRKRFDNDYTKLYAFLNDPSKMDESYALGLRTKPAGKVSELPATSTQETPPAAPAAASAAT